MNCEKCNEQIAAYLEKLLGEEETREMEDHLAACPACSALAREQEELQLSLVELGQAMAYPPMEDPVMDRIFREQAFALRDHEKRTRTRVLRVMITSAAAVLVISLVWNLGTWIDWSGEKGGQEATGVEVAALEGESAPKIDDWCLDDPAFPHGEVAATNSGESNANNIEELKKFMTLHEQNTQQLTDLDTVDLGPVFEWHPIESDWSMIPPDTQDELSKISIVELMKQKAKSHGGNYTGPGDSVAPDPAAVTELPAEMLDQLASLGYGAPSRGVKMGKRIGGQAGGNTVAHLTGRARRYEGDLGIGFSVGGAKDILNFRENIEAGFLPAPTDVTYEGLYYDYFFDTASDAFRCDDLFYPSYCAAVTKDPFSGQEEYYLILGMNSGLKSLERKKLNLVIVLDVSGSMDDPIDQYHYDGNGQRRSEQTLKIEAAKETLLSLVDHLNPDDRFGMVVFSDQGKLAKPLRLIGETDMESVRAHIHGLTADGSTNMSGGMGIATDLYGTIPAADPAEYENRIVFITDAMPNQGEYSAEGLFGMVERNAAKRIHSTFIGMGVDFNSQLVEAVTRTKGANYLSAHSAQDFRKRMVDEFDFMVTPLVFDLKLQLESGGYKIKKVYGAPLADEATGTVMKINTLFPSRRVAKETKGGVVLIQLARKEAPVDDSIFVSVKYEDRDGMAHTSSRTIHFGAHEAERFDNTGIRKAVLLARYTNVLKDWLIDARMKEITPTAYLQNRDDYIITPASGIMVPPAVSPALGQWERQSRPLKVNNAYQALFGKFLTYFKSELKAIGDDTLKQEMNILAQLAGVDLETATPDESLPGRVKALGYGK